ncbi:bunched [Carabus blaptoides fortunei]
MADNVTQKSPKSVDKTKFCNVIHRTTSETLRLGEADTVPVNNLLVSQTVPNPATTVSVTTTIPATIPINTANNQRKKPCSSFQITSVIVGRMNNDGGDDSADDLDESHADDISDVVDNSRITDNETPSYSEDTYSKEDVFFNVSSSSLCSAPVIPTSSQYGLAIVSPPTVAPVTTTTAGVAVNNNMNQPPVGTVDVTVVNHNQVIDTTATAKQQQQLHETPEIKDMQANPGRNDRFKVPTSMAGYVPLQQQNMPQMGMVPNQVIQQPTHVATSSPAVSYASGQSAQLVNTSYVNQLPQSAPGQSYTGPQVPSASTNVPTQGQSYAGQTSQIVGSLPTVQQGQSYSGQPAQVVPGYVAQQQPAVNYATGPGQGPTQVYAQSMPGSAQNYVVSMPSSPASMPQQPVVSSSQSYATVASQNYVQTGPAYPNQPSTYSVPSQPNIPVQSSQSFMHMPVVHSHSATSSVVYTATQFKGPTVPNHGQPDGPSPSEIVQSHIETVIETPNTADDNQVIPEEIDS